MKLPLSAIFTAMALSACGGDEVSPQTAEQQNYTAEPSFQALGQRGVDAVRSFEAACPRFTSAASDFENLTLSAMSSGIPAELGWHDGITISFKVKDRPANRFLVDTRSYGHQCMIHLGGGTHPGFISSKRACASICNETTNQIGDETFGVYHYAIPALAAFQPATKSAPLASLKVTLPEERLDWQTLIAGLRLKEVEGPYAEPGQKARRWKRTFNVNGDATVEVIGKDLHDAAKLVGSCRTYDKAGAMMSWTEGDAHCQKHFIKLLGNVVDQPEALGNELIQQAHLDRSGEKERNLGTMGLKLSSLSIELGGDGFYAIRKPNP